LTDLKKQYETYGYVKISNAFSKNQMLEIANCLENNNDDDVVQYFDNENRPRRIEKIVNNDSISLLNKKVENILEKIFSIKMVLFKDKYNVKPPQGEGFFAHYDSVFKWVNEHGDEKRGWYEYCEDFYNVLIAVDECNMENGTIEIANKDKNCFLSYDELFNRTYQDSSGRLTSKVENMMQFNIINLNPGDIVIFSDKCPHRSKKNNSLSSHRRVLYFTYNKESDGNFYDKYFYDKSRSQESLINTKSLSNNE